MEAEYQALLAGEDVSTPGAGSSEPFISPSSATMQPSVPEPFISLSHTFTFIFGEIVET